jgi:hypothetical protein
VPKKSEVLAGQHAKDSTGFFTGEQTRARRPPSITAQGVASPDRADALCLTFAMPVAPKPRLRLVTPREALMPTATSWMGS